MDLCSTFRSEDTEALCGMFLSSVMSAPQIRSYSDIARVISLHIIIIMSAMWLPRKNVFNDWLEVAIVEKSGI